MVWKRKPSPVEEWYNTKLCNYFEIMIRRFTVSEIRAVHRASWPKKLSKLQPVRGSIIVIKHIHGAHPSLLTKQVV